MNRLFLAVILVSFLAGILFLVVEIQPVKADVTIHIRADGSVEGTTLILTTDNVTYRLSADINTGIVVERDNIILDGAGHALIGNGSGSGTGIYVDGSPFAKRTNVAVQNIKVTDFDIGIMLYICENCTISGNNVTSNGNGISFESSENNDISRNNITANNVGLSVGIGSWDYNKIYHNNFMQNAVQVYVGYGSGVHVWDNGYPNGGNFWSDYNGTDLYSGQFQNESGSDGIGDSPYDILFLWQHMGEFWIVVGQDHYPLTIPFGSNLPFAYPTARFTYAPIEPVAGRPVGFNASTSACLNGTIIHYNWDFGDGEIGTGQTVSHIYAAYGNYNVSLTEISSTLIPDIENESIYVRQTPTATFSYSSTPAVGYPVTFDASASEPRGGSVTSYVWDFGDGNTTSTNKPTIKHTFAFQNAFSVTLTVLDSESLNLSISNSFLVVKPTFVSIHTSSSSNIVGYAVNVNGILSDFYGVPLNNKTVILSYTFPGATSWLPITSDNTNSAGEYHAAWIPTATGDFTLKAECGGNATHLGADGTVSLSMLSYRSESVFSVESNSTIADLSFNPAGSKLTFSVSGQEQTAGYAKVTFAKVFVESAGDVKVYLDGTPATFSITSTGDSWAVTSTYTHSTHLIEMDLTAGASENMPGWEFWTIVGVAASLTIVVAIALVFLGVRRNRRKKPDVQA